MRFSRTSIVFVVSCLVAGEASAAEIVDRVLAVVAGRVVTLSEASAARELGLVNVSGAADPLTAVVDQLVERELVLTEVERYAPPDPAPVEIETRFAAVRAKFPSQEAFVSALARFGYSEDQLREIVRDDLRIQMYLDQRFAAAAQPTDTEVAAHYREHETEFMVGGELPPMDRIQQVVREKLAAERRRKLISEWIAALRRRSEVTVLHLTAG